MGCEQQYGAENFDILGFVWTFDYLWIINDSCYLSGKSLKIISFLNILEKVAKSFKSHAGAGLKTHDDSRGYF